MKSLNRIIALARESAEKLDVTEIDTKGDLVGADTIDKEILELNELPGTEILEDLEALDDAVEEAEEMGAIAEGLIGEDTENEPVAAVAAEAIARRISAVAGKYDIQVGGFARESHDSKTAAQKLSADAKFVREGIIDVVKQAGNSMKGKLKSVFDAAFTTDDHVNKRVAQLEGQISGMAGPAGDGETATSYAVGGDFTATLKAVSASAKKLSALGKHIKASTAAIAKSTDASFEGEEKQVQIADAFAGLDAIIKKSDATITVIGSIIVDDSIGASFQKSAGKAALLDKKAATALLGLCKSTIASNRAVCSALNEAADEAYKQGVNSKDPNVFINAETTGNVGMWAVLTIAKLTNTVVNDATRLVEASIKASKAPEAKAE